MQYFKEALCDEGVGGYELIGWAPINLDEICVSVQVFLLYWHIVIIIIKA